MEPFVFLIGVDIVMLWIARDRIGGRSRSPDEQSDFDANRPRNYGGSVAPPGTSPAATVNAPWFAKPQGQDQPHSHGAGE